MAGGKGVNVARALKALGQPVIATGVAGGPTGTRIIEQLTDEAILNDFVRIREESRMSTAVVDPTSGEQTEINERGPSVSEARARAVRRQAAVPGQGRGGVRVLRQPPARRRRRPLRAPGGGAAAPRGDHRARLRGRAAAAGHPGRPRRGHAPTSSRPRSWWATSSPTTRTAGTAMHEMVGLGAREAVMTHARRLPGACWAPTPMPTAPAGCAAPRSTRWSRCRRSGRATPSWPATWPPATTAARTSECLRFGVACGAESTQHFGAGVLDPREVGAAPGRGRTSSVSGAGSRPRKLSRASPATARAGSGTRCYGVRSSAAEPRMPPWK